MGVVAYEMEGRPSGVGRYLEGLLRGLRSAGPPGWRWTLFFRGDPFPSDLFSRDEGAPVRAVFDGRPGAHPIAWEQFRLPRLLRRHGLDFLFSPAYSLPPFAGVPRMLTLHDLSFEHLPAEFGVRERWRRRVLARLAAARAERVLTDTRAVARDLEATYGVETERIGVVPLAVDDAFFQGFRNRATDEAELPSMLCELGVQSPYVLHLGSVLPRRRVDRTLQAFRRVISTPPGVTDDSWDGPPRGVTDDSWDDSLHLVLAGADRLPERDLDRRIADSGVADRIVRVPWVPEDALVSLYAHAAASVYVSTYEGYGLPPLESLATGTPAVVSGGLALDDLWPGYPFRIDLDAEPEAPGSLEYGLRRALRAPTGFAEEAREVIRRLDWTRSAAALVDEIRIARSGPVEDSSGEGAT